MSNWQPVEMGREALLALLKKAEQLTEGFNDAELEKLAAVALPEKCELGAVLTMEDERSRDLFVVVHGALSVEVLLSPADKQAVSLLKIRDGGVAGELSFVDGSRRSAGLKATGATTVLRFPYEEMKRLCETEQGIGFKAMRNLAGLITQRLRSTNFELRSYLA